jgi:hypothetical protein
VLGFEEDRLQVWQIEGVLNRIGGSGHIPGL